MVYNRETQEFEATSFLYNTSEAESVVLQLYNEDLEKKLADVQIAVKQITQQKDVLIKEVQNEKVSNEFYTDKLTKIMEMCKTGIQMMYELSDVTSDVLKAANNAQGIDKSYKPANKNKTYAVRPMISGHVISKPTIRLNRVTDLEAYATGSRFPRKRQALGTNNTENLTQDQSGGQDYLLDMEIQRFSQSEGSNVYSSSSSSSASFARSPEQNINEFQQAQAAINRNIKILSVRIDSLRSNILKNFKLDTSLYTDSAIENDAPQPSTSKAKSKATPSVSTSPRKKIIKRKVTGAFKVGSPKVMLRRLPEPECQASSVRKSPRKMSTKIKRAAANRTPTKGKRIVKKTAESAVKSTKSETNLESKKKTPRRIAVKPSENPKTPQDGTKQTRKRKSEEPAKKYPKRTRKIKLLVL